MAAAAATMTPTATAATAAPTTTATAATTWCMSCLLYTSDAADEATIV